MQWNLFSGYLNGIRRNNESDIRPETLPGIRHRPGVLVRILPAGMALGILTLLYLLPEATTGWTIGKWSMNLRIMTINAHAWIWPRCLARAFFKYSPMIFLLGLNLLMDVDQDFEAKPILAILILVYIVLYAILSFPRVSTSRAQRGLYDFIAGTIVVPRSDVTQPSGFEVIQRKNPYIDRGT